MAYPVESLTPNASPEEIQQAVEQTVQQLVAEGIPQDQAIQQAQEMMRGIAAPVMPNGKSSTNMTTGEFARGGSMMGTSPGSNGYTTVPNPRLNNVNPAQYPRGGY